MNILYAILYLILLGVASHYVGQWLPRRWFHPDRFPFRCWKWEQEGGVYRRLGIQHWKDLVPDMSKILPDMVPKRVSSRETAEEAMILVQETCVAEVVHAALMVLAISIVLICPNGWGPRPVRRPALESPLHSDSAVQPSKAAAPGGKAPAQGGKTTA